MSDTIDAAAQPSLRLAHGAVPDSAVATLRVPARDYVRLAQGFYFIFWGLLVTVLTAAQLLMPIEIPPFAELFLGVGVLATLIGSWRLYQVRSLGEQWHKRMGRTMAVAALLTYFCLFFYLWRRAPQSSYLLGNMLAFAATGIIYVIAFNRVVATLAVALGRKDMALEHVCLDRETLGCCWCRLPVSSRISSAWRSSRGVIRFRNCGFFSVAPICW